MFNVNILVVSEVGGGSQSLTLPTLKKSGGLTQLNVATKVNTNVIYSTDSEGIFLIGGNIGSNLENSVASGIKLLSENRLEIPLGCWVEIYKDDKLFYIGYVEGISYNRSGDAHYTSLTLYPALEALKRQGYLATQFESVGGLTASSEEDRKSVIEQQQYARDLLGFIQLISKNSYLKFFNVISDMPENTLYYSLFGGGDSNYDVIKMFSNTFSRFLFQLRTGTVCSTQLLDKEEQFGEYDLTDHIISDEDTLNYRELPSKIYYSYLNSTAITGGAIGVEATLDFEEFAKLIPYGNIDPDYENVISRTPPVAVSISSTQLLATQNISSITSPLVSVNERFFKGADKNKVDVKTYSELQILQEFFTRIKSAYSKSIAINTSDTFYNIDVGSTIVLSNLSYIVLSYSYNVNTNLTSLTLIPTKATSANILIQPAVIAPKPIISIENIVKRTIYGE